MKLSTPAADDPKAVLGSSNQIGAKGDELLEFLSLYNRTDRIIWGPWYGSVGISNSTKLRRFQQDL